MCAPFMNGAAAAPDAFRHGRAFSPPSPIRQRASAGRAQGGPGGNIRGLPSAEAGQVDPTFVGGRKGAAGPALVAEEAALGRLLREPCRSTWEDVRKWQRESRIVARWEGKLAAALESCMMAMIPRCQPRGILPA